MSRRREEFPEVRGPARGVGVTSHYLHGCCNNYDVSPVGGLLLVSDRSERFISLFKPRSDRDAARSNWDGDGVR